MSEKGAATKKLTKTVDTGTDKKTALETALAQIEKQFGKGAVMRLGQNRAMQVAAISTGSLGLDLALGIGGLPRGRIVEIYGPESSGKTTLALHCIAQGQKDGGNAAFIDVEHALDPTYAAALGVDVDSLLVSQPDTGEQALEITEALVRSGAIDVIVIDSVAALVPRAEIEGEYEHNTGLVIVERFTDNNLDPRHFPGVLVAGHGPFTWGTSVEQAFHNAVALEEIAAMATATVALNPDQAPVADYLLNKHFSRKHGPKAYYGQTPRPQ